MYTLLCGHKGRTPQGYRGNCYKCYTKYRLAIYRKQTTWAQLEAEGKVKKSVSRNARD